MKLTSECNGNIRRFSAKLSKKEHFDFKEIELLSAGTIPSLIPPLAVQGKSNNIIQFDISPYSTLEFYLSCILSREQLVELLSQCIKMLRAVQCAFLDYNNLVVDPDMVYVQLNSRTVRFIYLPLAESKREVSVPRFFRLLLKKAGRSTYEQVYFIDNCLAWLKRPAPFVLDEFEAFINGLGLGQKTMASVSAPTGMGDMQASRKRIYQPNVQSPAVPPAFQSGNGTVVLECTDSKPRFCLQRVKTGEKIEIKRFPFLVGIDAGAVSYCISDNPHVSHCHAEFAYDGTDCTITDRKSTNKTYVNGQALTPYQARILINGDQLQLADERFTFIQGEKD